MSVCLPIVLLCFPFLQDEPERISFDFQVVYELDFQPDSNQVSSRRKVLTELLVKDTLIYEVPLQILYK